MNAVAEEEQSKKGTIWGLLGGWLSRPRKKIHFSCYMDQPVEIGWKVEEAHDSQKKM